MREQVIEIEADSLEEARNQVKAQIPEGFVLVLEQIVSDGKSQKVQAIAPTTEEALIEGNLKG